MRDLKKLINNNIISVKSCEFSIKIIMECVEILLIKVLIQQNDY